MLDSLELTLQGWQTRMDDWEDKASPRVRVLIIMLAAILCWAPALFLFWLLIK